MKFKILLNSFLIGILILPPHFQFFDGVLKRVQRLFKTNLFKATITLTAVVGVAAKIEIFDSNVSKMVSVLNPDGTQATLNFPLNFLPTTEEVVSSLVTLRPQDILSYYPLQATIEYIPAVINYIYKIDLARSDGSEIGNLSRPINLTLYYSNNDAQDIVEDELKVMRWSDSGWAVLPNPSSGSEWVMLPSAVFPRENKIVATIDHFSLFGLIGPRKRLYTSGERYIPPIAVAPAAPPAEIKKIIIGDINNDNKVNLIDFSIMAYWWKRPLTAAAKIKIDLNNDGKLDLVDFSILAYWWTT